ILPASVGVREKDAARVVDDAPVHLLGHTIVEAAVACFHMVDRHAHAASDDRRQTRVGIAEEQHAVGPVGAKLALDAHENLPSLLAEPDTAHPEVDVRRSNAEVAEEDRVEPLVEVLTRVNEHVVNRSIEELDDEAEADDLGARPQHRHQLHRSSSTGSLAWSSPSSSNPCKPSIEHVSPSVMSSALELYSPDNAVVVTISVATSGSIGLIAYQ